MKKHFLFVAALLSGATLFSQHATFESPTLLAETAWYGQDQVTDGDTIYNSGSFNFENNYNAGWGSFSGWGVSNITDNTTPGWGNQYSAITGEGEDGSDHYGICYVSSWNENRLFNTHTTAQLMQGMYVANTTYAYLAMLNGDDFTKPFGADTNAQGMIDGTNGEDWFLLTIYALDEDSLYTGDSINFYLADFRFSNDVEDYIIDEWTYVDLSVLGPVKGLDFKLSSTDTTGGFGMNNPAYFAMDNLIGTFVTLAENSAQELHAYPNPTNGILNVKMVAESSVTIFDSNGKMMLQESGSMENLVLDLSAFERGIYFLQTISDGVVLTKKIVKN